MSNNAMRIIILGLLILAGCGPITPQQRAAVIKANNANARLFQDYASRLSIEPPHGINCTTTSSGGALYTSCY